MDVTYIVLEVRLREDDTPVTPVVDTINDILTAVGDQLYTAQAAYRHDDSGLLMLIGPTHLA